MAKNLIPEIARMLGVELGEEFKLKDKQDNCVSAELYKFSEDSLLYRYQDQDGYYTALSLTLYHLFRGDYEVIKLPWKPKKDDDYYTFSFGGFSEEQIIVKLHWDAHPCERALLDKGWIYRTLEEAKSALPKVATEIGVEYKL